MDAAVFLEVIERNLPTSARGLIIRLDKYCYQVYHEISENQIPRGAVSKEEGTAGPVELCQRNSDHLKQLAIFF